MNVQLTKEQMRELGIADKTPAQRDALMYKIGKVVFDAAIIKLLETLTEEQLLALNHTIDGYDSFEAVVDYLKVTYPSFEEDLQRQQEVFIEAFANRIEDLIV